MAQSASVTRTTIARFTYAAEAGFFAEALEESTDIVACVLLDHDFDAMSAMWQSIFLLQVAEEESDRAIAELERLLVEHVNQESELPPRAMTRMRNLAQPHRQRERGSRLPDQQEDQNERLAEFSSDDVSTFRMPWGAMALVVAAVASGYLVGSHNGAQDRPRPLPRNPVARVDDRHKLVDRISQSGGRWQQVREADESEARQLHFDRRSGVATVREDVDGDGIPERVWQYDYLQSP